MRKHAKWGSLLLALVLLASLLTGPASAASRKPYIKQVEAGTMFSLAVTSNGDLYG